MDKSAITMTADDDWWLERITIDGDQRYPKCIRVGSLENPRVYVPERTCRVGCYPPGYEDNLHYEVCSECGTILTASRPGDRHAARASYCPSCGARVASGDD